MTYGPTNRYCVLYADVNDGRFTSYIKDAYRYGYTLDEANDFIETLPPLIKPNCVIYDDFNKCLVEGTAS